MPPTSTYIASNDEGCNFNIDAVSHASITSNCIPLYFLVARSIHTLPISIPTTVLGVCVAFAINDVVVPKWHPISNTREFGRTT